MYLLPVHGFSCICALQVEKGATAAVFGLGTIGLAVIDALREAGAKRIIAVDTDEGKFERAQKWGATDLINPKKYDKPIQARRLCHPATLHSVLLASPYNRLPKL